MRSVVAPPDPDEVSELLDPGAILNLVFAGLAATVGGQVIANLASSVDVEQIGPGDPGGVRMTTAAKTDGKFELGTL